MAVNIQHTPYEYIVSLETDSGVITFNVFEHKGKYFANIDAKGINYTLISFPLDLFVSVADGSASIDYWDEELNESFTATRNGVEWEIAVTVDYEIYTIKVTHFDFIDLCKFFKNKTKSISAQPTSKSNFIRDLFNLPLNFIRSFTK